MKQKLILSSLFGFFFLFFLTPSLFSQDTTPPLRLAVLDAVPIESSSVSKQEEAKVLANQWALTEVFCQDVRKIPNLIVLEREKGIDFGAQIAFLLLDKKQIELHLRLVDPATGNFDVLRKLKGPQDKVLEMFDDFTFVLAQHFSIELDSAKKKWIQNRLQVSAEAWDRYGRGLDFARKGNQAGAILALEQFKKAEFFDILFLPTYVARAKANLLLYRLGHDKEENLDMARENVRKALFADSKYLEAYELLAEIYFEKGESIESIREALRALRLNPLSLPARLTLIRSYAKMNKQEELKRELDKLLEIDPSNTEAKRYLSK